MELTLGNHDVYFVTIGARTTSQKIGRKMGKGRKSPASGSMVKD
jgi:hypothetical protein